VNDEIELRIQRKLNALEHRLDEMEARRKMRIINALILACVIGIIAAVVYR
jgi:BMFP domain-containing protein YqiC